MKKYMILLLLIINVIFLTGCDRFYYSDGETIVYKGTVYYHTKYSTDGFYEFDGARLTSVGRVFYPTLYCRELFTLDSDKEKGILISGYSPHYYSYFEKFNYVFVDKNTVIKSIGFEIKEGEYFDLNLEGESFSTLFILDRVYDTETYAEHILYEKSFKSKDTYIYIYYEKGMKYRNISYVDDNKCIYYQIFDRNSKKNYWFKLSDKYNNLLYNKLVEYNIL